MTQAGDSNPHRILQIGNILRFIILMLKYLLIDMLSWNGKQNECRPIEY